MKLEYAVVSSNSNPEYLDFWPYVAKAWKDLIGLKPVLLYIDDNPPPSSVYDHGEVFYFKSINDWSIVQQAQCIRFWASKILDKPFIISDMDMLPISRDYYINHAEYIGDTGLISYSSDIIKYRWYRTNPQYPMCYLAGDPNSFVDLLEIDSINNHEDFLRSLKNKWISLRSGVDQKHFYNQTINNRHIQIKHLERGWIEEKYATGRLDKVIWPKTDYNAIEYIDCHLPRPLKDNLGMCKELFSKLKID
jgi:hypothetical protein